MRKIQDDVWSFNTRDLMRAASCEHCIKLAVARELHMPGVAELIAPYDKPVEGLPITYGNRYEAQLEAELRECLGDDRFQKPSDGGDQIAKTIDLMNAAVPVIYQGSMRHRVGRAEFSGRPDFLVRADYELDFEDGKLIARQVPELAGKPGYIAWDAKLAGSAKPNYLLQVALYIDALDALGLKAADAAHGLVLGSRRVETFEEGDVVPAMRQARENLSQLFDQLADNVDHSQFALENLSLYCPVASTCDICEYPDLCAHTRVEIDHLVQVAGINKSQIQKLQRAGITTMAQLGAATDEQRPSDFVPGSFDKLRKQARLQTSFKTTGKHSYELVNDPEIGVLPPASKHDVFFDMEGFPYFAGGGLEYLFGAVNRDKKFFEFWAHDRQQEKQAFIDFMQYAIGEMNADPTAHIYHYAPYEQTALNRLAARHGVMEKEVSQLFEEDRLIDLYKVVRGSILVSQPSYSIKYLEPIYGFERTGEVSNAAASIDGYEDYRMAVEVGDTETADTLIRDIGFYNETDCVSTLELYEWLAAMPGAGSKYAQFRAAVETKKAARLEAKSSADGSLSKAELELERLISGTKSLMAAVESWPEGQDPQADYNAKIWLAITHSMLYYNREEVIQWRDLRIRRESTDDALASDRKALVARDAELIDEQPMRGSAKTRQTYRYFLEPGQTAFFKEDSDIYVRFDIGANQHEVEKGKLISNQDSEIVFTRETTPENRGYQPNAIFANEWLPIEPKPGVVGDWVHMITDKWGDPRNPAPTGDATIDLLMRRKPKLLGDALLTAADVNDYLPALLLAVDALDNSTLAVQGPPGSGKTYLASRAIKHLLEQGKSIGVVANSHSAVENLLKGCISAGIAAEQIAKRNGGSDILPKPWIMPKDNRALATWRSENLNVGTVVGGTSWVFCAAPIMAQKFDYMFIDEAAQFSLVDAIAIGANTKNIVMLGDPQQLTQVVQAVHPGGVDNSALGHYMGEQKILDADHGYFVEVTRRMHPKVNEPVSWLSYEGRLHSHPDTNKHVLEGLAPGLTAIEVQHDNNSTHSVEEVEQVLHIIRKHVDQVGQSEILVVSPYNAQVDLLRQSLDAEGYQDIQVGTVDKFQGREANIVIISLAASTAEDAPRGLEFLLDRNRLNVALSRAKTNSFLVYSPLLTRTSFRNVQDVKCISRLAGLLAFAN